MVWDVLTDVRYWRFLLLSAINLGTRMVSMTLPLLLPPVLMGEMGNDTPFGLVMSLSPLFTLIFLYLTTPCSLRLAALTQITIGSFLTSLAPVALLVAHGPLQYSSVVLFLGLAALGESVSSPRMY